MNNSDMAPKMNIVSAFVEEIQTLKNTKQCLNLAISNFDALHSTDNVVHNGMGLEWESQVPKNSKFDLIIGYPPLGLKKIDFKHKNKKLKVRENWSIILTSLKYLLPDGIAIFLVEPMAFSSNEGVKFEELLNSEGYFVNAILNAPEDLLKPETAITPVIVAISDNLVKSIFVAELLNQKQSR
ncbi:MAG: hypothetical protein L3J38_05900, partial [Thiomicrorhabdus sp.]|nr:hypothetical protein [Thiomicrorhabdus sp.]